jgi:hypothetical protein
MASTDSHDVDALLGHRCPGHYARVSAVPALIPERLQPFLIGQILPFFAAQTRARSAGYSGRSAMARSGFTMDAR